MFFGTVRRLVPALGLLLVTGCLFPVAEKIDKTVCDLAVLPHDLQPAEQAAPPTPSASQMALPPPTGAPAADATIAQAAFQTAPRPTDKAKKIPTVEVPQALTPGGQVPPIDLPAVKPENEAERKSKIGKLYPSLPSLGEEPTPVPGPKGLPLTLADLHRLALANSPLIKQAAANVEAARGVAIQVGLPPNPTTGFETDTFGTTGGWGYMGFYVDQVIKTGNKLQLARAVATMDMKNAEVALRKANFDLTTKVRGAYFSLLVARETVRVNRALVRFTDQVFDLQLKTLRIGGFSSAYEPASVRALAVQARANLVQARNAYLSAWKQLAANMGLPGMPLTEVAGRIDIPLPIYDHAMVLAHVLANNTDVRTAENTYHQSKLSLKLAQMQPIPDVDVRFLLQKDRTGPPYELAGSVQVSVPVPLWNRNQGGIMQAQGLVIQASEEPHRVRTVLAANLAAAFQRYQDNRILIRYYRDDILPDQVRYYRGVFKRFQQGEPGGVNIGDVIVAQQNLAGSVATYLTTLGNLWQAVVDVTDPIQTLDLFQLGGKPLPTQEVAAIDLEHLPGLPGTHPCSPLPGLHQRVLDGSWPPTDPGTGTAPPLAAAPPSVAPAPPQMLPPMLPAPSATTAPPPLTAPLGLAPEATPARPSADGWTDGRLGGPR